MTRGDGYRRSFLHAAGLLGVLVVLAFAGQFIDLSPKETWLGVHGFLNSGTHLMIMKVGVAITLAVSLNLILGIAGQFSLGHAGFLAAGAYTSILIAGLWFEPQLHFWMQGPLRLLVPPNQLLATAFQMILLTGMVAGGLVAAAMGLLVGMPTLRLRGDYLAIATLGVGEILSVVITNTDILGRSTGLDLTSMRNEWCGSQPDADAPLVQAVSNYMSNTTYYVGFFWVFAVAAVTIYVVRNIKYATSGRALLALRENAIASESVGVPTTRYKVTAFVIGAGLAGMAGGLVSHIDTLNPDSFRFMRSVAIVAMVILGGQGSITGAVLAAIALESVPEILRSHIPAAVMDPSAIEKWRMVIYSLFIVLAMLFAPRGLFGRYEINDLYRFLLGRRRTPEPVSAGGGALGEGNAVEASLERLLAVEHVTMQFGGLRAVDDFNLDLVRGEVVGLIGPNGAGKTTVFNVLTGVYRPTKGAIRVGARSVIGKRPHTISRLGVARTFQNIRLFDNLSVIDNVKIAQHAHHRQGIPSAILRTPWFYFEEERSQRMALEFLDLFGLAQLAQEQASSLSYGDQRRLEIARALATRPKILLLDEPAAGMNPTEKRELMEMIQSIRVRFGLTILIIEHDMKVIMGVCQRIIVLDYGKTIAQGTPQEIRRNPAVIEAYLGAGAKQG